MSSPTIPPQPNPPPPENRPEQSAEDRADNLAALRTLRDIGLRLAAQLAPPTPQPPPAPDPAQAQDPTIAFDRIARAVRRTVLLIERLNQPEPGIRQGEANQARRTAARKQVIRHIQDRIHARAAPDEKNALEAEFQDRLDAPDLDDDLDTRPVMDVINEISRDLGLTSFNEKRRTPEDLEALAARAAEPAIPSPRPPRPGRKPPVPVPPPPSYRGMDDATLVHHILDRPRR